jgi:hypothetical protein
MAVEGEQFGKPGRGMSIVGNWYQRTAEGISRARGFSALVVNCRLTVCEMVIAL